MNWAWLKQQKFISRSPWGWRSSDQGVGRIVASLEASLWKRPTGSLCPHVVFSLCLCIPTLSFSSCKDIRLTGMSLFFWLHLPSITLLKAQYRIYKHIESGLQHVNFEGTQSILAPINDSYLQQECCGLCRGVFSTSNISSTFIDWSSTARKADILYLCIINI